MVNNIIIALPRSMSKSAQAMLYNNKILVEHGHLIENKILISGHPKNRSYDLSKYNKYIISRREINIEWVASMFYARYLEKNSLESNVDYHVCLTEDSRQRILDHALIVKFPVNIELGFVKYLCSELNDWILYIQKFKNKILFTEDYKVDPRLSIKKAWGFDITDSAIPGFKHPRPAKYNDLFLNYSGLATTWVTYFCKQAPAAVKDLIEIKNNAILIK